MCSFDLSRSHPLQQLLGQQHAVSLCLQAHFWGHVTVHGVHTTTVLRASGMPLLAGGGTPACGKCRLGLARWQRMLLAAGGDVCHSITMQQQQMQSCRSCHNLKLPLIAFDWLGGLAIPHNDLALAASAALACCRRTWLQLQCVHAAHGLVAPQQQHFALLSLQHRT